MFSVRLSNVLLTFVSRTYNLAPIFKLGQGHSLDYYCPFKPPVVIVTIYIYSPLIIMCLNFSLYFLVPFYCLGYALGLLGGLYLYHFIFICLLVCLRILLADLLYFFRIYF